MGWGVGGGLKTKVPFEDFSVHFVIYLLVYLKKIKDGGGD